MRFIEVYSLFFRNRANVSITLCTIITIFKQYLIENLGHRDTLFLSYTQWVFYSLFDKDHHIRITDFYYNKCEEMVTKSAAAAQVEDIKGDFVSSRI